MRYLEWSQIAFIVLSILSHGAATVVYVSCRKIFYRIVRSDSQKL